MTRGARHNFAFGSMEAVEEFEALAQHVVRMAKEHLRGSDRRFRMTMSDDAKQVLARVNDAVPWAAYISDQAESVGEKATQVARDVYHSLEDVQAKLCLLVDLLAEAEEGDDE